MENDILQTLLRLEKKTDRLRKDIAEIKRNINRIGTEEHAMEREEQGSFIRSLIARI